MPYLEKLKMIKEEKGLTNTVIAKAGNVPLPTVTRVFNGNTQNATLETYVGIARGMGISLDELAGLKQPDEQPISSPIIETINSYSELLKEKDETISSHSELLKEKDERLKEKDATISELIEDKKAIRKEKNRLMFVTLVLGAIVAAAAIVFIVDAVNGHFGYFRY